MKNIVIVCVAAAWVASAAEAHAGDCSDLSQVKSTVLKVLKGACAVAGDKFDCEPILKNAAKLDELERKWNKEFKDSRFKIGPRALPLGKRVRGTLIGGGQRTWIAVAASDSNTGLVTVKKHAGKAADVTVCTIDPRGIRDKIGQASFSARSRDGSSQTLRLKGIKGKVVMVKLNAKKLHKFKYDVTLKAGR